MWWLVGVVIWDLGCALAAQYVAWQKGRPLAEGFFLGTTLGPIGALVVALLPDQLPSAAEEDSDRPLLQSAWAPPSAARTTECMEIDPATWR